MGRICTPLLCYVIILSIYGTSHFYVSLQTTIHHSPTTLEGMKGLFFKEANRHKLYIDCLKLHELVAKKELEALSFPQRNVTIRWKFALTWNGTVLRCPDILKAENKNGRDSK